MPEKDLNLEAGVFMVNLTFYTTHQRFLATSARPVRIWGEGEGEGEGEKGWES